MQLVEVVAKAVSIVGEYDVANETLQGAQVPNSKVGAAPEGLL